MDREYEIAKHVVENGKPFVYKSSWNALIYGFRLGKLRVEMFGNHTIVLSALCRKSMHLDKVSYTVPRGIRVKYYRELMLKDDANQTFNYILEKFDTLRVWDKLS